MSSGELRIGIIGAGQVTRKRHLPGFAAIPGVRVVGVCNLHRDSTSRAAREFNIPKIYGSWENLVEDDEIDAVVDRRLALPPLSGDPGGDRCREARADTGTDGHERA